MPTDGSSMSAVIAPKATTIGNVAGAAPPSYVDPVACANSVIRSHDTAYGGVGGKDGPAREASTVMAVNLLGRETAPGGEPGAVRKDQGATSARLAVRGVGAAARAELLHLH